MTKHQMAYFEREDILHLSISDDPEVASVEISPNITAELNEKGELIGIEILNASTYVRDAILESVQAKMLQLYEAICYRTPLGVHRFPSSLTTCSFG